MGKAVRSVAPLHDGFALHLIQEQPHLLSRKMLMIQPLDKFRDRLFEINVVFPKGVVGINQQSLFYLDGHERGYDNRYFHHGGTEIRRKSGLETTRLG